MRALSDSSEEVPHGPRCQAYRPDRRPLGTHSPALHFRAIGLPTAFALPDTLGEGACLGMAALGVLAGFVPAILLNRIILRRKAPEFSILKSLS